MNTHDALRKEIDEIDHQLVKLFEERMKVSLRIAEYKIEKDISIFDAVREKEVVQKNVQRLKDDDVKPYGESFFNSIMGLSRQYQHEAIANKKISYK